jgi:DNA-binding MarR family transcriptional regulator
LSRRKSFSKAELVTRSEFRHQLRRFERIGEEAARERGVTFAQYLLLLYLAGMPERDWALVGELAERLQLEHHSTVGLVSRCESAGLVERRRSDEDRREVQVHLTRAGRATMMAVVNALSGELDTLVQHLDQASEQA